MIYGIGADIVAVSRVAALFERHGERAIDKLLAPQERAGCREAAYPAQFLAKRFAAKEALGKALGTGVRAPALLTASTVIHDALGKPSFEFSPELARHLAERGLIAHLSLSDERDSALAFVVLERI